MMRSDKLGYNAPIEVYDLKYYRYADPDYSINDMPLTVDDFRLIKKAIKMLSQMKEQKLMTQTGKVLSLVEQRLTAILNYG